MAFGSKATDRVPRWSDITDHVQSFDCDFGRNEELDRVEAGTATAILENDGRFTPGRNWLVGLDERFNSFGVAVGATFTVDSGQWLHVMPSSGALSSTTDGVSLTGVGTTTGQQIEARYVLTGQANVVPAALPGTVVRVSFRARASSASNLTSVGCKLFFSDDTTDASSATSTLTASAGAWVTGTHEFTVPAGTITRARPAIVATKTGGTSETVTLEVAWCRVETPSPYAGLLKSRIPVRAYTILDDNWVHRDCVNASGVDTTSPRWQGRYMGPVEPDFTTVASTVVDAGLSGNTVFELTNSLAEPDVFHAAGLPGDADVVHVTAGQTVAVDADVRTLDASDTANAVLWFRNYDGYYTLFRDFFDDRTNTNGFGPSWAVSGGLAPEYSVSGGRALMALPTANVSHAARIDLSALPAADLDVTNVIYNSMVPVGAGFEYGIRFRMGGGNFCEFRLFPGTSNTVSCALRQVVSGVETVTAFPTVPGVTAASNIRWRIKADGSFLQGKAWLDGQPEPETWNISMTTTLLVSGDVELRAVRATGNTNVGVAIGFDDFLAYVDGGLLVEGNVITGTTWGHSALTYTTTEDGYVLAGARSVANTGAETCRVANMKMRLNGVGSSTVAPASGLFPTFRGLIERWKSSHSGGLSTCELTAVDSLVMLSGPIESYYRYKVREFYDANAEDVDTFLYWPCVEASDSQTAEPLIGDIPLRVVRVSDDTSGFTSAKTMVHADGSTSGGFTVDGNASSGSSLTLVSSWNPFMPSADSWGTSFWFTAEELPQPGDYATMFATSRENSPFGFSMTVDVLDDGSVRWLYEAGNGLGSFESPAGVVAPGEPTHIAFAVDKTGTDANLTGWVNGSALAATIPIGALPALPAAVRSMHYSGNPEAGMAMLAPNGTINHIVWIASSSAGGAVSGAEALAAEAFAWGSTAPLFEAKADPRDSTVDPGMLDVQLDAVKWRGTRWLDPGVSELLSPRWDNGAAALTVMGDTAESADGLFFAGQSGEMTYHNRRRRMGAPVKWTVTEHLDGLEFELDDQKVYNQVAAERSTGLIRVARDETSIADNGVMELKVNRDVNDPDGVAASAAWLLHRYREGIPRCDLLEVDATTLTNDAADAGMLALAHGANLSDRLRLERLSVSTPSDEVDFFIEGVAVRATLDGGVLQWRTILQVSEATGSLAWVLEDETSGLLDAEACVLAY